MNSSAAKPSASALVLAFTAIYLIWGSTYLGIRIAIESMPPFLMAAGRFLIAGALLFIVLKIQGRATPTPRQWRINTVIGTFLLLGGNGLVAWAEQFVPSGITALIIGVQPLFFALTEWAWPGGSRPAPITAVALLIGFSGVAWLAAPWESPAHGGLNLIGVTVILSASAFWAIGSIYSRHARHDAEPLMAAAMQMLTGGTALALVAWLHGEFNHLSLHGISTKSWVAFVYLILFGSLIGFSTFVWLIKHATPARVSTYAYVNPVVAVFLGWWIANEPVGPRTIAASVVIVTAVIIITSQKTKPRVRS